MERVPWAALVGQYGLSFPTTGFRRCDENKSAGVANDHSSSPRFISYWSFRTGKARLRLRWNWPQFAASRNHAVHDGRDRALHTAHHAAHLAVREQQPHDFACEYVRSLTSPRDDRLS